MEELVIELTYAVLQDRNFLEILNKLASNNTLPTEAAWNIVRITKQLGKSVKIAESAIMAINATNIKNN